jgi:[ribosomal protein S18]-alanine N-acetyltransferase
MSHRTLTRRAVRDDLPALASLEAESFDPPWSAEMIVPYVESEHHLAWIAVRDRTPCGYLLATSVLDEGEIDRTGVKRDVRRSGVGLTLLEACLNELLGRGVDSVWLEVAASNTAAIGLYSTVGFEATGTRRGYYAPESDRGCDTGASDASESHDAIRMRHKLRPR